MKRIDIHIHAVKQFVKNGADLDDQARQDLLQQLTQLEDDARAQKETVSDRILSKPKFIDAIMATVFEGRSGSIEGQAKLIREQLERCYDAGTISGIGKERSQEYNLAVIIRRGTISELWADRPGLMVHKYDIDRDSEDPVIYSTEEAEFASLFNESEILKSLESKFE